MRIPLAVLALSAACSPLPSEAGSVSLLEGRITCALSDDLTAVPEDELRRFMLRPMAAYVKKDRSARLTITKGKHPSPMTEGDLPEVKAAMELGFAKLFPDATWAARELITINGRAWIHFDFTGSVNGTLTRSELYVTSFVGDQLQFLFQSNAARHDEMARPFNACIRTLRVRE